MNKNKNVVDICFSPVLYPHYSSGTSDRIVVVVDIFRASTTMCMAFSNGVKHIIPVASIEEAKNYKEKGYLVGAERNVKRCIFADFGNSPFDYTEEIVKDKEVVFSTTNGTRAIEIASDCKALIIGAFSNISAVAEYCIDQKLDVIVLCAGWNNRFNMEDSLFAGALASILIEKGCTSASDATQVALSMWKEAKPNIAAYIGRSEHIKRLELNGLQKDAEYCLQLDTIALVPVYNKETKKIGL